MNDGNFTIQLIQSIMNSILKNRLRKSIRLLIAQTLLITGCSCESDLDRMHVNGNVEKIETVSLTNIPIMEYYSEDILRNAVPNTDGNYILYFNRKGNVSRYQGFGCEIDELFDVKPNRGKKAQGALLLSDIPLDEIFDSVAYELNEYGDVALIEWYEGEKVSRQTIITYDSQQRPSMCVANSGFLGDWGFGEMFLRHDTTIFLYTEEDRKGNWTEMQKERRSSFMPERNNTSYRVLRQITYREENQKQPLMEQAHVRRFFEEQNQMTTHVMHSIRLGDIATISVPNYMTSYDMTKDEESMTKLDVDPNMFSHDLCRYEYTGKYYASFSVGYFANAAIGWDELTDEEKVYDKEIDDMWRKQYELPETQKMISLLKWYPYSFVNINGHCAILTRYIRYGKGSPIPVYVESYQLDTPDGGAVTITMSYQINQRRYFHQDFINAVYSFRFNQ